MGLNGFSTKQDFGMENKRQDPRFRRNINSDCGIIIADMRIVAGTAGTPEEPN